MLDLKLFIAILLPITAVYTQDEARPGVPKLYLHHGMMGGVPAEPQEIPSIVSVRSYGPNGFRRFCAGTLVTAEVVLTAAQCIVDAHHLHAHSTIQVVAGARNLNSPTGNEVIGVVSGFIQHPGYNNESMEHDIGLMILQKPIEMVPGKIQSVNLAQNSPTDGEWLSVAGWAGGNHFEQWPAVLQKVYVPHVPNHICASKYPADSVKSDMLCAGKGQGGEAPTCQDTPGNPLFRADGTQVGITSWGYGCLSPEVPGVYTSVPNYMKWIKDNLPNKTTDLGGFFRNKDLILFGIAGL